jgi:predicted small lipoprotein YifL
MKKTIIILLTLLLTLGLLAGCGSKDDPGNASNPGQQPQTQGDANNAAWSRGDFAAAYINILTGSTSYIKYRSEVEYDGQKMEAFMEVATDGKNTAAITNMGSMGSSTVIIKDDTTYMVSHENKMILISSGALDINQSEIPQGGYVFKDSGSAELFGVLLKYEEYTTDGGDVRFFFDGDKLAGFESSAEGITVQMEVLELSDSIPAGMFDVPDDYEVIDMSAGITDFSFDDDDDDDDGGIVQ